MNNRTREIKTFVSRVLTIYGEFRGVILTLFLLLLTREGFGLVAPYLYGTVIDNVIGRGSLGTTFLFIACALAVSLVNNVGLAYLSEWIETQKLDFDVRRRVAEKTLEKVLAFSIGQHLNYNSGIRQSVINRGEHSLTTLAYVFVYDVLPIAIQLFVVSGALFALAPPIGLVVIGGAAAFIVMSVRLNHRLKKPVKKLQGLYHGHERKQAEILRNIAAVQLNAQEERALAEHARHLARISRFGKAAWGRYAWDSNWRNLVINVVRVAVMAVGALFVHKGIYTPGSLLIFLAWSSRAFDQLGRIGSLHRQCMDMYAAVKKYFAMLDVEPEIKELANPVAPAAFAGRIEFRGVSFCYPTRQYLTEDEDTRTTGARATDAALDDVSFVIEAGMKVAIVGPSGAGKSTLIMLLVRAYDPDRGQILVDGHDLRILRIKRYRQALGIVPQDVSLFDETLRYNIGFGVEENGGRVPEARLREITRLSRIDTFFGRLEAGFDTMLGERGVKLSGGERQRVGIARALIKDPNVLIFDEATSSLDTENELLIKEAIDHTSRGRTTIIIAHRLSTIQGADKIIVLDEGRIVGAGTHAELERSSDVYNRLIRSQTITIG